MRIQLYDRGSPQGKKLFADLEYICKRLQVDYDPEYIQDMSKPYSMGIQGKTIMTIDNGAVLVDEFPSQKELEAIIMDFMK